MVNPFTCAGCIFRIHKKIINFTSDFCVKNNLNYGNDEIDEKSNSPFMETKQLHTQDLIQKTDTTLHLQKTKQSVCVCHFLFHKIIQLVYYTLHFQYTGPYTTHQI